MAQNAQKLDINRAGQQGAKKGYLYVKRVADILFAIVGLIVLFWPMVIIALIVKLDSPGPALFRQQRLGLNGVPFTILKFRTMKKGAPENLATADFCDSSEYITRVGAFLRRSSLDELPQLFNILRGDMSFVGYRPVCLTEEHLNRLRQENDVFVLRPGITGLAQVNGRDALYYKEKVRFDKMYVEQCSAKTDLWCCLKTVQIVISGKGVK